MTTTFGAALMLSAFAGAAGLPLSGAVVVSESSSNDILILALLFLETTLVLVRSGLFRRVTREGVGTAARSVAEGDSVRLVMGKREPDAPAFCAAETHSDKLIA